MRRHGEQLAVAARHLLHRVADRGDVDAVLLRELLRGLGLDLLADLAAQLVLVGRAVALLQLADHALLHLVRAAARGELAEEEGEVLGESVALRSG